MGDIAKWLLQNLWAGLVIGAAAGFAIAVVLTYLAYRLRKLDSIDEEVLCATRRERQRLLLLCGDVKALADLAIQRHMNDVVFLKRLRAQPSFDIISPHFSEEFRQHVSQELSDRKESLALAVSCRKEVERIEHEWSAMSAKHG